MERTLKERGVSRLVVVTQGVEDSRVQAKGVLAIIKKETHGIKRR
jgi:hypothetical protein